MDVVSFYAICQIVIFHWILCPSLTIYYSYQFWNLRWHTAIQTRNYKLTLLTNFFFIIYSSIVLPIFIFNKMMWSYNIASIVGYVFRHLSLKGAIAVGLLRVWLLYYDTRFTAACEDGKWTRQINPAKSDSDQFIRKKGTLGNAKWIIPHVWGPFYLISLLITAVALTWGSGMIPKMVDIAIYGMVIVYGIWMRCTLPTFETAFGYRRELALMCYVCAFYCSEYLITSMLWLYFPSVALRCITYFLHSLCATALTLICTYWVIYHSGVDFGVSVPKIGLSTYQNMNSQSVKPKVHLTMILKHRITFEAFMRHCLAEYCGENLLCLYELVPFRNHCHQSSMLNPESNTVNNDEMTAEMRESMSDLMTIDNNRSKMLGEIELPSDSDMVRSEIVFDSKLSVKEKVHKLIGKYIRENSDLCVNISYMCRKRLVDAANAKAIEQMNDGQLSGIFDEALTELYMLLLTNFSRFKRSSLFLEIAQQNEIQLTIQKPE